MRDPLGQLRLRFTELTLRNEGPHGQVFSGRDFTGAEVTLLLLGEQAADDPARRRAFAEAIRHLESQDMAAIHSVDLYAARPWAAVRSAAPASGVEGLLAALNDPRPSPSSSPTPESVHPVPHPHTPHATRQGASARGAAVAIGAIIALVLTSGVAYYLLGAYQPGAGDAPINPPPAAATPTAAEVAPTEPSSPLRDVPPVSVIGPVWQPDDDTYTMAFPGWPFAFRAPSTWLCVLGSYDSLPDASAWQCSDPDDAVGGQRVNVMLWECPTTCTDDEQTSMIHAWLDEPERAVAADSGRTVYVETGQDGGDLYSVDLSHFAPNPADPGGPLRWHVGVYLQSPFETRDVPLKILNDIITQAS